MIPGTNIDGIFFHLYSIFFHFYCYLSFLNHLLLSHRSFSVYFSHFIIDFLTNSYLLAVKVYVSHFFYQVFKNCLDFAGFVVCVNRNISDKLELMESIKLRRWGIFSKEKLNSDLSLFSRQPFFKIKSSSIDKMIFFQWAISIFQLQTRPISSSHNSIFNRMVDNFTNSLFQLIEGYPWISCDGVLLGRVDAIEFDTDSVDFVLEFSRPIQVLWVRFDEEGLMFENAYIVKSFSVVIR